MGLVHGDKSGREEVLGSLSGVDEDEEAEEEEVVQAPNAKRACIRTEVPSLSHTSSFRSSSPGRSRKRKATELGDGEADSAP